MKSGRNRLPLASYLQREEYSKKESDERHDLHTKLGSFTGLVFFAQPLLRFVFRCDLVMRLVMSDRGF